MADDVLDAYGGNVISAATRFGREPPAGPPLQPPGGGGPSDPMLEARIASLETHVEYIKRDVTEIRSDIGKVKEAVSDLRKDTATLTERVAHLPSRGFIVKSTLTALAIIGALVLFQGQIQRFSGLAPAQTATVTQGKT